MITFSTPLQLVVFSHRYIVSFLLDSSVGLLVIWAGIRLTIKLSERYGWKYLYFGEYGKKRSLQSFVLLAVDLEKDYFGIALKCHHKRCNTGYLGIVRF